MDIQELIYFNCAAYYLNFTKAANVCNITQVAMSRGIARIESELGFKLFTRVGKRIILTPEGEAFYYDSNAIVTHYNQAVLNVKTMLTSPKLSITIGYGAFDKVLAIRYCNEIKKLMPNLTIYMYRADYNQMYRLLSSNVCDIVFAPESRLKLLPDIRITDVYHSHFVCLASVENPLSTRDKVSISDFSDQTIVYPENLGRLEEQMRLKYGSVVGPQQAKHYLYANCTESLLSMVSLNQGISVVPDQLYLDKPMGTVMIPLEQSEGSRRTHSAACMKEIKQKHVIDVFDVFSNLNDKVEQDLYNEIAFAKRNERR